ncbi:MAG: exosortase-associated EpsI family protein [Puniceicoccaceae bacterium]
MRTLLFSFVLAWVSFGMVLQFFNPFRPAPGEPKPPHLASTVASSIRGWSVEDVPLGPTENVANRSLQVLQFDDFVYRRFSRGQDFFEIYAAYWGPSKMPMQKVASHTPDRCWTEAGWKVTDLAHDVEILGKENPLKPAQWRSFDISGTRQYVFFWHVVGDRLYDYGEHFNAFPHPMKWLRDAFKWNFGGSEEQYFIRINGNISLKLLLEDEGFLEALESLRPLGLNPDGRLPITIDPAA